MRIAVFCSASTKIDDKYVDFAFEVGKAIADQGWDVAWGGGTLSMMGSVSRGARSVGGKTFGVIPQKLIGKEFADEEATELFITESMRSRKAMLEDLAILTGGEVIAEELGLVGAILLIAIFVLLVLRIFRLGRKSLQEGNHFGGYLAYGVGLALGIQFLVNIGVSTGEPAAGFLNPQHGCGRTGPHAILDPVRRTRAVIRR